MRKFTSATLALSALGLLLPGCGGGGGEADATTVTIISRGAFDGGVDSSGNADAATFPQAGSGGTVTVRGIYEFVLTGEVPAGATIEGATLLLDQFNAQASAYAALGDVVCDHIDLDALLALDSTVFAQHGLANSFALVSADETLGVKSVDVTARVQADVNAGRGTSSYRIHFSVEGPLGQGTAFFSDGEGTSSTAQLPRLVVTFR